MFVFQLFLISIIAALVPLAYVWTQKQTDKFSKLAWITTWLTFDLILFGSFTRLTDSGLGCPDWPGCYGTASPLVAQAAIQSAERARPNGPVTMTKAWIEMVHRYLAMTLGVLIIVQAVAIGVIGAINRFPKKERTADAREARSRINFKRLFTFTNFKNFKNHYAHLSVPFFRMDSSGQAVRRRTLSRGWPIALLFLVGLQGAFGAWTVTLKLQPIVVTTHLLLGMTLLGTLSWFAEKQTAVQSVQSMAESVLDPTTIARWQPAALVGLILLVIQIALGGWVSANNGTGTGWLTHDAWVVIQRTHRSFAWIVIAYLVWLGLGLRGFLQLRPLATRLIGIVAMQLTTGLLNTVLTWPPLWRASALAHNAGASLLLLLMVMLNARIASSA